MSPDVILENYGEEALLWAYLSGTLYHTEKHKSKLEDAGYNLLFLEKSKNWCRSHKEPNMTAAVRAQYNLGLGLMSSELLNKDILPGELQQASREGINIDENRAANYKLLPITIMDPDHYDGYVEGPWNAQNLDVACPIWLDTPFGVALTYKGQPQAVVGFAVSNNKELLIHQLQVANTYRVKRDEEGCRIKGSRKPARGLAVLDWQRFMVNVAAQVASGMGLEQVGVQQANKNRWTRKYEDGKCLFPMDRALQMYDQTAERLGFQKGEDGDWHVSVSELGKIPVAELPAITHEKPQKKNFSKVVKWLAALIGKNQSAS